eukprot:CAMPEP_0202845158 /NCGR_PEP_ID=MMETSP1389-20130828/69272_1 /ASSEMBLY_ACC=CAM_ASM_000865 /TAXON_ID=302021 /ORGANISM="Rhodomonas sp., Strain CCMP768" /LENGTH=43 /DNA_ID= /DNA_START= /DNA_END= /DNA_ORIENTATION=
MELAQGGDLLDRVVREPLSESEAMPVSRQIVSAVGYLHTMGVV